MKGGDLNTQLEALKRQLSDLVREMHARKLAIPAGALLAAIIAAVVLLPKSSTPPPAPPTASAPVEAPKVARVAQVSLIKPASLDEDIPLTESSDPFTGSTGYECKKVSSNPKMYDCLVSDVIVRILCSEDADTGPCAEKAGASGETGASGKTGDAGGGGSSAPTGGTDKKTTTKKKSTPKDTIYTVDLSIDGKTYVDAEAGDELPSTRNSLVVYAGTNDSHSKAVFIAGDGVVVTGVPVDSTFGSFTLSKGQSATLTDAAGVQHQLKLSKINKVME